MSELARQTELIRPSQPLAEPGPTRHWCWIGSDDSPYLVALVDWLRTERVKIADDASIHLQIISVTSPRKIRKALAKSRAEVLVWAINESAIADVLEEIAWASTRRERPLQIAAGMMSPSERTYLLEAGINWHVGYHHEWPKLSCHYRRIALRCPQTETTTKPCGEDK